MRILKPPPELGHAGIGSWALRHFPLTENNRLVNSIPEFLDFISGRFIVSIASKISKTSYLPNKVMIFEISRSVSLSKYEHVYHY